MQSRSHLRNYSNFDPTNVHLEVFNDQSISDRCITEKISKRYKKENGTSYNRAKIKSSLLVPQFNLSLSSEQRMSEP